MKNNKMVMTLLILLIAITLVGAIAIVMILNLNDQDKGKDLSIDKVIKYSVDIPELTTNLANDDFIRISFKIQTDSKKAKKELDKRIFQVNNIIILELSEKKPEDIKGKDGQKKLEENVKVKINELMQDGTVEKVYITQFLLQ